MPRARSPNRDKAKRLWLASAKTRSLKDIAVELDVSEEQVRKWKSQDHWDDDGIVTLPIPKVTLPIPDKMNSNVTKRLPGGQPSNSNAAKPHEGAPQGNTNRLTHGAYCKVFDDLYTGKEQEICMGMDLHRVSLLKDEIRNLTIRERRLLQRIAKYEAVANGLAVHDIVKEGDKATTTAVTTFEFIKVLEAELTKVQRAKSLNIRMLFEFVEEEDSGEGREDALEFVGALDNPSEDWEDNDAEAEAQAGADEI